MCLPSGITNALLGLGKDRQCFIKVKYKFYLDRIRKILMVPGIRAYTNSVTLHSNAPLAVLNFQTM